MKMNRFERWAMNNPVRAMIQKYGEAPILERLGGRVTGQKVLEVGCGRGVGTEIILTRFGAEKVVAIDLDPRMIDLAGRRLSRWPATRIAWSVGDLTRLDAPDRHFDAVFDFAAIHHVEEWRSSLWEIRMVLKPGGRFFFEEVTAQFIHRWPCRWLFDHPRENRFTASQWRNALEEIGFSIDTRWAVRGKGDFVFGVGVRREGRP